jgi:hypothetical protein
MYYVNAFLILLNRQNQRPNFYHPVQNIQTKILPLTDIREHTGNDYAMLSTV